MLIIVSKCISTFPSQVILNDVHYHKYHHHHHWQISCKSVTVATRQHDLYFACLTYDWRPIFRCARSFSTLRVQVVLWRSCGLLSGRGFLIVARKALRQSSSGGKSGNVIE